jgi:hypothetical protein
MLLKIREEDLCVELASKLIEHSRVVSHAEMGITQDCYFQVVSKYTIAFLSSSGLSLNLPNETLHSMQSNPRTLPVAWSWSTCNLLSELPQMAQPLACSTIIVSYSVGESPYFEFR